MLVNSEVVFIDIHAFETKYVIYPVLDLIWFNYMHLKFVGHYTDIGYNLKVSVVWHWL